MKFRLILDPAKDEEVVVTAHEKSTLTQEIERLVTSAPLTLLGYRGEEVVTLQASELYAVTVQDGKVYAVTKQDTLRLKQRLYQAEEQLGAEFLKINQSCLVNIRRISRFQASLGGALSVVLQNGYTDYVSRRRLREVKERLGL